LLDSDHHLSATETRTGREACTHRRDRCLLTMGPAASEIGTDGNPDLVAGPVDQLDGGVGSVSVAGRSANSRRVNCRWSGPTGAEPSLAEEELQQLVGTQCREAGALASGLAGDCRRVNAMGSDRYSIACITLTRRIIRDDCQGSSVRVAPSLLDDVG
jgi:hypothetical protein